MKACRTNTNRTTSAWWIYAKAVLCEEMRWHGCDDDDKEIARKKMNQRHTLQYKMKKDQAVEQFVGRCFCFPADFGLQNTHSQ